MRIFFVTCEYIDPDSHNIIDGGLANYLYKITHLLKDLGHEVNVLVTSNIEKTVVHNGINVFFIKPYTFKYKNYFMLFASKTHRNFFKHTKIQASVKKFLESQNKIKKIDIIQYASVCSPGLYPLRTVPSCVRISSYAKLMQKGYDYKNHNEIKCETQMFKKHKFIFGPSKYISNEIKKDLNLKNKIKIIETPFKKSSNEIDITSINKLQQITDNNPYLLFFGTLGLLKGCKEISDCIYDVLNTYSDLYFVFVGKSVPIDGINTIELIKDKAKEHKNRVVYFDSMNHSSLYPIIENARACVMPSRVENFSNTCIESMAFKKIVIGTNGYFDQIIDDCKSGFLCEPENSKSLKIAISKVMNLSDDEFKIMGEKAYERTLKLSPDKIIIELLSYYDYVIKNWHNKK